MPELAVTAIGTDRPGIVAAVAEALRDHGGNIEDSAMTILGGRFAIMLVVAIDEGAEDLRSDLDAVARELGLQVTVSDVEPGAGLETPTHVLSVYGSDKPGILAGVTRALADLGVNITDLSTRMLPPDDQPVYAMVLEIALPDEVTEDELERVLGQVGERIGVDHTLRPLETETY